MPTSSLVVRLAVSSLAVTLAAAAASPIAAQDATPEAGTMAFPISPDPAACQIAPRSADELLALWYTPEGTPVPAAAPMEEGATSLTIPVGVRADEATVAAVVATVSEVFGCFTAGDLLRASALFTDELLLSFGGEPGESMEDARAFLEGPPAPESEGEVGQLIAVTDVMDLEDGRVGAFIVDSSDAGLDTVYAIFVRDGDRLLADEIVDFLPVEEDM